mmetsp:Transcript_15207/g.61130  ORF Transcript_15207/g.61130 Transcript_15207/m.61130 type:complete len:518 (-) Transcript_15207:201-1754(-)
MARSHSAAATRPGGLSRGPRLSRGAVALRCAAAPERNRGPRRRRPLPQDGRPSRRRRRRRLRAAAAVRRRRLVRRGTVARDVRAAAARGGDTRHDKRTARRHRRRPRAPRRQGRRAAPGPVPRPSAARLVGIDQLRRPRLVGALGRRGARETGRESSFGRPARRRGLLSERRGARSNQQVHLSPGLGRARFSLLVLSSIATLYWFFFFFVRPLSKLPHRRLIFSMPRSFHLTPPSSQFATATSSTLCFVFARHMLRFFFFFFILDRSPLGCAILVPPPVVPSSRHLALFSHRCLAAPSPLCIMAACVSSSACPKSGRSEYVTARCSRLWCTHGTHRGGGRPASRGCRMDDDDGVSAPRIMLLTSKRPRPTHTPRSPGPPGRRRRRPLRRPPSPSPAAPRLQQQPRQRRPQQVRRSPPPRRPPRSARRWLRRRSTGIPRHWAQSPQPSRLRRAPALLARAPRCAPSRAPKRAAPTRRCRSPRGTRRCGPRRRRRRRASRTRRARAPRRSRRQTPCGTR